MDRDQEASPITPKPQTVDRVKHILRNDLMLGAEADIPDDVPLFGGDFDLDSLDTLLLVTSVEKEFGLKIPNESIGQEVFASVNALACFIDKNRP